MVEELSLEQGIERIIELAKEVEEKPVLIGIYGLPNSGKSYLGGQLSLALWREAMGTIGSRGSLYADSLRDGCTNDYLLLYMVPDEIRFAEKKVQAALNRGININVLIYNPRFQHGVSGIVIPEHEILEEIQPKFDVIIANTGSTVKASPYKNKSTSTKNSK